MPRIAPLRLTHARCLMEGRMADHALTIADGHIAEGSAPEVNLSDYLLLPGIIDLHGDGFERHLTPRPSAPFDRVKALSSAAAELAVNGITTAWFAQSWSWEGAHRSGAAAVALMEAIGRARPALLPDLRMQLRLETHVTDEHPEVIAAVETHGVDFVVFNNHLPEAQDMARNDPARLAQWAAQTRRSGAEMMAIVEAAAAQAPAVSAALAAIAERFARMGVRLGSHDDDSAETRAFYRDIGAPISEFPTTLDAARAARAAGDPVLMGAPNVVRGGSQSGNIAAEALIAEGLVDALMSDYYYPALAQAAFALEARGMLDLPSAWALISAHPARIMGMADRGHLGLGARADLVVVHPETHRVEMTLCAGRIAHLSGELARRVWASAPQAVAE
ncbi:alpha-D-ribose 1-methylphosphonate 5-triphosphate diphosphatase [Gemmobacter denitrificans]|uniref:Alpha-D-ribose 1-methylphosphonate 5-triphosphate diphosphatase n=1 Tax=Gemmobacter denitrificans TaxID=3123040 RepID=A0ABU8BYV6_9RHOB